MDNRYGSLASWVYDLDKPVGHSFGDLDFYANRLGAITGPILEPAVGNGRVLIPLRERGFEVVGFDASEDMLARCRAYCKARGLAPPLSRQRFEDFAYPEPFAAIIIPAGSFQLITDFAQARATLERFHAHLRPGGLLLLDLDSPRTLIETEAGTRDWRVSEDDLLTLTIQPMAADFIAQTTHAYLRYEHWRGGRLACTELERFKLRWWGVEEIAMVLREVGFTDVVLSSDYQYGHRPHRNSHIFSVAACRR